jgi:hypothetical protein
MLELEKSAKWLVDPLIQERVADERGSERAFEIRPMALRAVAVKSDVAMRRLIRGVPTVAPG